MKVEYQVIVKSELVGKRALEGMLPSLGADGFRFALETPLSYVFWREVPVAEPGEMLLGDGPVLKRTRAKKD